MKPTEEHDIDEQNVIVQLGMLILKGRSLSENNRQFSENNVTGGLTKEATFHHEKEAFLSLWKCCEIVFIEVWLHRDKQFKEEEAVQGHSSYLLMEQWQIEVTKNSSETGFHCTGKMLIQAIKSKLYFSQLSAWLNLSKGEFPKYTHFRLRRQDNRVALQTFCKPPEFHQFPRVSISSSKELLISLRSLPRFDIATDFPRFSWVLGDTPSEKPTRSTEDDVGSLFADEFASPVQNRNLFGRETKAVRKLVFTETREDQKAGEKCSQGSTDGCAATRCDMLECREKVGSFHALEMSSAILPSSSSRSCSCCSDKVHYRDSTFSRRGLLFGEHPPRETCRDVLIKGTALERTIPGNNAETSCRYLSSTRRTAVCKFQDFDEDGWRSGSSHSDRESSDVESYEKAKTLDSSIPTHSNPVFKSGAAGNRSTSSFKTNNLDQFKTMGFRNCSPNRINDFDYINRGLEEQLRFTDELYPPGKAELCSSDKQSCSKFEDMGAGDFEKTLGRGQCFVKGSPVFPKIKRDFDDVLPGVRRLIEEDVKRKLNEKLWKCLSPEKRCCHGDNVTSEHCEDTREDRQTGKDNVFSGQRSTISCLASRHHFRHASTGTLPVFHPSTGLPMSSSPAPFRKPRELSAVDDIQHSSHYDSFKLHSLSGVLSKSAPTLTPQGLLGNFEESVLNDRLLPDGVVEGFSAELSASSSRKCLAHVTLPVEAYFFKLSDDNAPSPYMGYISLDIPELPRKGYHVPKKGTIQLTLFNPNQTVVKVFVVLYDFSDMQPSFRTFLRQKTTSLVESDTLVDTNHDNLHYLIHLRFASSKSGRVYLHTDIRVIFARHPPDQVYLKTTTSGPTNPKYVLRQDTP